MASYSTSTKAFKWEGVDQMKKLFATLAEAIGPDGMGTARDQLKDAMMPAVYTIRDEAQDLAPVWKGKEQKGQPPPGSLRESIFASKGLSTAPGVIAAVDWKRAPYAIFVENGTSKMVAQPFFRPAVIATRPLVANIIADGMKPIIEGMAAQLAYHP